MSKASKEGSFLHDEVINTKDKVIPIDENSTSSHDDDAATSLPKIYTPKITAINLVDPSRLFSTPPPPSASFLDEHDASTLVFTADDDEECVNNLTSSVTRETSINEAKQNVGSVVGTSSSSTSSSSLKPLVAGPQQKQHSQRGARKVYKDEDPGEISPKFAEIHQELRKLLGIYGCGISQQQQLLNTIKLYINLCRNEFDEVIASAQKCRRLVRSMPRMMDLLHQISLSFEDTFEYVHRMIELVAIYVSCELRYAKEFKEHKPLIANRILQNIYIYLKGPKKDDTTSYILRIFAHMSSMYREREVMTKIFQTIIPKEQVILQRELPDNIYIQYLIVFYHWQQLELVHEDKMGVIEFANKFMRPSKTLCTNATYAYHLPKYNSLGTATQYILNNLNYFHDLKLASIYDNRLKTDTGTIDISEDNQQSFTKATVNINFAELVQNTDTCPAVRPMIKLEDQVVIATIDLTIDNSHENDLQWMQDLQRNATKMEPARNALAILATRYRAALTEDEVIEIESDTDEETNVVSLEEEPLSLEEPEHLGFDETEYMDAEGNELNDIGPLANESVEKAYRTDNNFINDQTTAATAITTSIGEHSSTSLSQQIISNSSKLNIISVRSIAPTQSNKITHCERASSTESTDHDPTPSSSQLEPIKYSSDITKAYSSSTTQTEFTNFSHLTVTDSTTPQNCSIQDLPDKPNIIEVRSIGKIHSPFRKNAISGAGRPFITNQYDLTQLNPQIRVFSSTERSPINTSVSFSDEKYMCRRNSLHINSSPIGATQFATRDIAAEAKNNMIGDQERNDLHAFSRSASNITTKTFSLASTDTKYRNHDVDDDDDELYTIGASSKKNIGDDGFNSSKVIYSVNKIQIRQKSNEFTPEDDVPNYIKNPFKSNKKKLVQFSNRPVEHKRNTGIQYPIKPAIKNTANSSFNTQHTTFNSCFGSSSPASTTSSTYTKSQPNRKEPYKSIPDEFIRYYSAQEDGLPRPKVKGLPRQTLPDFLKRCVKKPIRCSSVPTVGRGYITHSTDLQESLNTLQQQSDDEKLKKKCCVLIEHNRELQRQLVEYMNELLQKQRENRQQALERKRRDEERRRILNEKLLEEQMLKEQITELKRQQEEKNKYRAQKQQQQEKDIHRNRLLQRERTQRRSDELRRVEVGQLLSLEQSSTLQIQTIAVPTELTSQRGHAVDNKHLRQRHDNDSPMSCLPHDVGGGYDETFASTTKRQPTSSDTVAQKKHEEKLLGEEEEIRLLRTPTPERNSEVEIMPYSTTKSVKVRVKRAWRRESIKKKLRTEFTLMETKTLANVETLKGEESENESNAEVTDKEKTITVNNLNNPKTESVIGLEKMPVLTRISSIDSWESEERELALLADDTSGGVAPSSGLVMLANTAATAAVAETQVFVLPTKEPLDFRTTTTLGVNQSATGLVPEDKKQKNDDDDDIIHNNEDLDNDCTDNYLPSPQQTPIYYDSSELRTIAITATANDDLPQQSNLKLINIIATPTVPPYLFNGESRDVSTPTPTPMALTSSIPLSAEAAKETATVPVDSSHCSMEPVQEMAADPVPASTTTTTNPAPPVLFTSDHEVSSTQETLCETLKSRNLNQSVPGIGLLLSLSTSFSSAYAASPKAAVQNNQIDTTHHVPESTTKTSSCRITRRRTRKLSIHDESMTDSRENCKQRQQTPLHKRRKTICGDAVMFRTHSPMDASALVNESEQHTGTSPSTTTITIEKPTTANRRGRQPLATAATKATRATKSATATKATTASKSATATKATTATKAATATKGMIATKAAIAIKATTATKVTKSTKAATTKKNKRIKSAHTSSPAPPNTLNEADSGSTVKCNSPGLAILSNNIIKHTYSMDNVMKNVFVPPEIEECLKQDNLGGSKAAAAVIGKVVSTVTKTKAKNNFNKAKNTTSTFTNTTTTTTSPVRAAIKNTKDKKKIFKTVEGAKMKILHTRKEKERAAAAVAAAAAAVGAASVASPAKKKSVKASVSARRKR